VVAAEIREIPKAGPLLEVVARPRLSLIIPAYNEEARLGRSLTDIAAYLANQDYSYEIVVSDDGSTDDTLAIANRFAADSDQTRVLSIRHAGKAAAIRAGMRAARGDIVAFTDADLATPISYMDDFIAAIDAGADVVIGSREGSDATRVGEPHYRHVMGRVFNRLVQSIVLPGIDDTQCGFKAFTRFAANEINRRARLYAEQEAISGARVTAFDVEMLVIARELKLKIVEVPVIWTYGQASKVNPISDTWHNFSDIMTVKVNATRGRYR
jgi:glycosyltransferase involved in cell wall biosynthesis